MKKVKALNKSLEVNSENVKDMVSELMERVELSCSGNICSSNVNDVCTVHSCQIVNL